MQPKRDEVSLATEAPPLPQPGDSQAQTFAQWRREAALSSRQSRAPMPWDGLDPHDKTTRRIFELRLNEYARTLLRIAAERHRSSMHREIVTRVIADLERELGVNTPAGTPADAPGSTGVNRGVR